jgi:hypothetical protein
MRNAGGNTNIQTDIYTAIHDEKLYTELKYVECTLPLDF